MVLDIGTLAPQSAPEFKKYKSGQTKLVRIEVYVGVVTIFLTVLVLFGSFRRCSRSSALKYVIWTAYFLSTYLVGYITGQMQSAPFYNEMFAVWAVSLGVIIDNIDSISAYSLEDNERQKRYNLETLVRSFWVGYIMTTYLVNKTRLLIVLYVIWFVFLSRADERIQALASASRSHGLQEHSKLVSDYMCNEHESSQGDEVDDPVCMKGYNYLVAGEKEEWVEHAPPLYQKALDTSVNEVVTVHKIWECKGSLLSSRNDPSNRLNDVCLSFALYRLLRRRFGGYPLHESSLEKTWNFVRHGLLSEKADNHERAFRVIEVELALLYDSLYTKYPAIFAHGLPKFRSIIRPFIVIVGYCWIIGSFLLEYHTPSGYRSLNVEGFNVDVLVTYLVIITVLFIEVVQLVLIYFSDWAKVMFLCKYVVKPSWQRKHVVEKILGFVCHCRWLNLQPWERKLGQYSLMESFNHDPSKLLYNSWTSPYLDKARKGQKESRRIKLTAEAKKAITLSLKTNGRRLSNGTASLQRNGFADQFSWACQLETQTYVILTWHIATSLCEMSLQAKTCENDYKVATALSSYCAYLAAFKPRLLPDHAYTTEVLFDQVIVEARRLLDGCNTPAGKYEKMMRLADECDPGQSDRMVIRAAKLGKQLIECIQVKEELWKVLAEFWAEMMLFVAPSDDVTAHAENLTTGGEFVTHLWALLTHAGILERPEQTVVLDA